MSTQPCVFIVLDISYKYKIRDLEPSLNTVQNHGNPFISKHFCTLIYQHLLSMQHSPHVLRGQYSYQNGFFVLNLPTLEPGKISTLVVGNISKIGSRLRGNIDFLYPAVKEKGTLTKEHPQP